MKNFSNEIIEKSSDSSIYVSDPIKKVKETNQEMMLKFCKYSIPSVLSCLIIYFLEGINLIFAGNCKLEGFLNEDLVNAVGVSNLVMNLGGLLFGIGITSCLETLCSQAFGRNNNKDASMWLKLCKYFITFYFILILILCIYSKQVILFIGQPENISEIGSMYIKAFIPSLLMQLYISCYVKFLYSQGIYYKILSFYFIGLVIHPLWCWIFLKNLNYQFKD